MPNTWLQVLDHLRPVVDPEEYRRWFGDTAYASDSGDQITVWVPSESVRRHLYAHYLDHIDRALSALNRRDTHVRLVVGGVSEDENDYDN